MEHYFFFKLHFSLTLYMTGVIWLVQLIHYPLFKLVGEDTFKDYHKGHIQKTSLAIAAPMVLEFFSAMYLLFRYNQYRNNTSFLVATALLGLIWAVTFLISVPKHNILSTGQNDLVISILVKTNWIRTIAWTIRAILLFNLL